MIDIKFLAKFPEFAAFHRGKNAEPSDAVALAIPTDKSPEEVIRTAFSNMRQVIASELLDQIKKCSPAFFEQLVADLLVKMGYGGTLSDAGEAIGRSGDGGIDGTIKEDKLGLDVIYIQAKRWEGTVGRPQIQNFVGALHGKGNKGVFITTSAFTKDASDYAKSLAI
mgnify:CR=1 FL=1